MTATPTALPCALLVALVLACAAPAGAQDERDISLSVLGGRALIDPPDIGVTQPTPFIDGEAFDVELEGDLTFGVKLTTWRKDLSFFDRIDFGFELDLTRFTVDMPAQTASAGGASAVGALGAIIFPISFDIQSHVFAINLLWRYPVHASEAFPSGRWHPYFGFGGGASLARMRQAGGPWRYDASPALQGLAGLQVYLTRHLGVLAEYKRTQATHAFSFTGFDLNVPLGANHFMGGVAVHF